MTGGLVVGCGGVSHHPSAATRGRRDRGHDRGDWRRANSRGPSRTPLSCQGGPCFSPEQYRVAYGIQSLLDNGIDGRGETVTVVAPVPPPGVLPISVGIWRASTDVWLPAARIEVVTTLAGSASPWQATGRRRDLETACGRPCRHAAGGPDSLFLLPKRRERDRGHARGAAARRLPNRRDFDQLEPGRTLLHEG